MRESWVEGNKSTMVLIKVYSYCCDKDSIEVNRQTLACCERDVTEKKEQSVERPLSHSWWCWCQQIWADSRWAVLQGSLCVLSAEWAEEADDTLELRTKPKAARRPAGRRLVLKPGGRRPDWLALGSRDLEAAAWGWAAAAAVGGGGGGAAAWWGAAWSSENEAQNVLILWMLKADETYACNHIWSVKKTSFTGTATSESWHIGSLMRE